MSLDLSEKLLPLLRDEFAAEQMRLGPERHILATFFSPHSDVGCIAIQDDGDEITLFLGDRTHLHFGPSEDRLSEQEKAENIVAQVMAFLRKLFADQIEFYGIGCMGGCRERSATRRSLLSRALLGYKTYVWSGPLT